MVLNILEAQLYILNYLLYIKYMIIKSIQNLVSDAMGEIKTIDVNEAYQMTKDNNCNLIDIREITELENTGRVDGANHIPRGMLEVYLDPNSPIFQNGQIDKNKEFVLFCAGGVRSALAVKSLKEMGYEKTSHIDGGFAAMSNSSFKII
jgi:rhodanese-related sulfurtransferase